MCNHHALGCAGVLAPDQVGLNPLASNDDDDSDTEMDRADRTAEASTSTASLDGDFDVSRPRANRTRGPIFRCALPAVTETNRV